MVHQAIAGHLFVLCSRLAVVAVRVDRDAAARSEFAPHLDVFRVHQLDQVVHDHVHAILVKIAVVAEAEQVQLERFALDHFNIRDVADVDRSKIRLSGDRTQTGELRAVELDEVVAVRVLVVKRFQYTRVV